MWGTCLQILQVASQSLYIAPTHQDLDPSTAQTVVKGDAKCTVIAAASIIAKVV